MNKNTIKSKSKQDLNYFANDEGKSIITSFSLPIWNKRRLKTISKKLKQKGYNKSTKEIIIKSLQMIMTKTIRQNNKAFLNRAVRYNNASSSYENVSVRMNPQEYNSLHAKKMTMKVSLSYLLDLALRLYLRLIMNLFLQKRKEISTYISYYKEINKFNYNTLFYSEKVEFFVKI